MADERPGDKVVDPRILALARDVESVRREAGRAVAAGESARESAATAVRRATRTDEEVRAELRAIRAQVDELVGSVGGVVNLSVEVSALARQIQQVAASIDAIGGDGDTPDPVSWFEVDAERAQAMLTQLTAWVNTVLVRYRAGREILPECWMLHPETVEELLWLFRAWCAAYREPEARAATAGDWHERWLPGVHRRLKDTKDCQFSAHFGEPERGTPGGRERAELADLARRSPVLTNEREMVAFVEWWCHTRGLTPDRPPGVSDQPAAGRAVAPADRNGGQRAPYDQTPQW